MEQINTPTDTAFSGEVETQSTEAYSVDWGNPPIHHTGLGVMAAIEEMPICKPLSGARGEFEGVLTVVDESPFVKLDEPASSATASDEASPEKINLDLSITRLPDFIDFELDANRQPGFIDIPPTWTADSSQLLTSKHVTETGEQALDAISLGSEETEQRMERMELHIDPDAPIPDSVIKALEATPGQEITVKLQRSPVLDMAAIMVATGAGQLPFPNITQPKLRPGQCYWTEHELAEFDKQNQASVEALRLAEEKRQRRMQRNLRNAKWQQR